MALIKVRMFGDGIAQKIPNNLKFPIDTICDLIQFEVIEKRKREIVITKKVQMSFTQAEYKIISEMLLSVLVQEDRPARVMRAAEKTQDVEPVAYESEEWHAINAVIDAAADAFLNQGVNLCDFK